MIRARLEAEDLTAWRPSAGFTNADRARHIMKVKKKLPGKNFTVVLERPFVVIGDDRAFKKRWEKWVLKLTFP